MDMEKAVSNLSAVKQELVSIAKDAKSPTVLEAARFANMFLDTAYLWLSQVYQLVQMQSPEAVEKVAEEALANGTVIQGDFSGSGSSGKA